jgi:hypothetical protein
LYSESSAILKGVFLSKLVPRTGVLDLLGVRTFRLKRGVEEKSIFVENEKVIKKTSASNQR